MMPLMNKSPHAHIWSHMFGSVPKAPEPNRRDRFDLLESDQRQVACRGWFGFKDKTPPVIFAPPPLSPPMPFEPSRSCVTAAAPIPAGNDDDVATHLGIVAADWDAHFMTAAVAPSTSVAVTAIRKHNAGLRDAAALGKEASGAPAVASTAPGGGVSAGPMGAVAPAVSLNDSAGASADVKVVVEGGGDGAACTASVDDAAKEAAAVAAAVASAAAAVAAAAAELEVELEAEADAAMEAASAALDSPRSGKYLSKQVWQRSLELPSTYTDLQVLSTRMDQVSVRAARDRKRWDAMLNDPFTRLGLREIKNVRDFDEGIQSAMDLESFCRARRGLISARTAGDESAMDTLAHLCSVYETALRSRAFRMFNRSQRIAKVCERPSGGGSRFRSVLAGCLAAWLAGCFAGVRVLTSVGVFWGGAGFGKAVACD